MREEHGVDLATLTTMRVGGPADRLVRVTTTDELVDAVHEVDDADWGPPHEVGEPLLVLGGGSNLVVADEGFPGTVVRVETTGIQVESDDRCGGANVRVAAGEPWDDVVAHAVDQGWAGIEALSGIPGSTGATPIQNVGAYGQEVAETIVSVRVLDRASGQVQEMAGSCVCVVDTRTGETIGGRDSPYSLGDRRAVTFELPQLERLRLPRHAAHERLEILEEVGVSGPILDRHHHLDVIQVLHLRPSRTWLRTTPRTSGPAR